MPTYSFKCDFCNTRFEKSLKISEKHSINCPACNKSTSKMPSTGVGLNFAESKKIPKDIDLAVGKDAERKWMDYEEKKKVKEKIRKDTGSERLAVDLDGNYRPFTMKVDGEEVSGDEGAKYRKKMLDEYMTIKKDPETQSFVPTTQELSKIKPD